MPTDPLLPAAADLLGPGAAPLLQAALAGTAEVTRWWRSRIRHVPGRRLVVRYGVQVAWPGGRSSIETMVAETTAAASPPAGTPVLQSPSGGVVWLWRYPFDPHLPGLARAADPVRVRELLDQVDAPAGPLRLIPRAYRPTRRAVIEVVRRGGDGGPARFYLKVLPPPRVRRIAGVHLAVARTMRAPLPLASDPDDGLLLLAEVPGPSLRAVLTDPAAPVPPAAAVVALQQRLAAVDVGVRQPPPRPFGVARGAASLRALLPDHAAAIDRIAAVAEAAADVDDPVVTIHGDLHEGQLIVGADGGLGLVDLDGTGPGAVVDDAATTLAHLLLLGRWHPATRRRSQAHADGYAQAVGALVDPQRVRHRAAGVLLGLAAGSFTAGRVDWQPESLARLRLAAALSRPA